MSRRLIAALCLLALVFSLVAVSATATEAATSFEVGYAMVDINPYVYYAAADYPEVYAAAEDWQKVADGYFIADLVNNETGLAESQMGTDAEGNEIVVAEGGPDGNIDLMSLPLRGYGNAWNRPSTYLIDDNNDGVVDVNDGLKATCVTVTYDGNTVVFITFDSMNGYLSGSIKEKIYTLSQRQVKEDQIMISGTHIHTAPDLAAYDSLDNNPFDGLANAKETVVEQEPNATYSAMFEQLYSYGQRIITDISEAAVEAYNNRAEATLEKSQIDTADANATAVYEEDGVTVKGHYTMNGVRHYIVPEATSKTGESYVYGDSFNPIVSGKDTNVTTVSDVNDTLYLLKFAFTDGALPVVIANWRAIPTLNAADRSAVSSDYLNAFRTSLAYNGADLRDETDDQQVYRVAAFQGATGNVTARSAAYNSDLGELASKWINNFEADETVGCLRGNGYGAKLAQVALECLAGDNWTEAAAGQIRVYQTRFYGDRNNEFYSDFSYYAAEAAQVFYDGKTDEELFYYPTDVVVQNAETLEYELTEAYAAWAATAQVDAASLEAIRAKAEAYITAGTDVYVISSSIQATNILDRWVPTQDETAGHLAGTEKFTMETNAILLGGKCAIVTSTGNLFDRYYDDGASVALADASSYNAWDKLIGENTWGEPVVMGLCNGTTGLVPNSIAYEYNAENENLYAVGSFEAHSSRLAKYTGEKLIDFMAQQLSTLSGEDTYITRYCRKCQTDVEWTPLHTHTGQENLFDGHYYLADSLSDEQRNILDTEVVHLDLCGNTVRSNETRAYYVNGGGQMSIQDTVAEGAPSGNVIGHGGLNGAAAGFGGSTLFMASNSVLDIYGGTFSSEAGEGDWADYAVYTGGVAYVRGTMNLYGGTIAGGKVTSFKGDYTNSHDETAYYNRTGRGGAVYVDGSTGVGKLNVYGGTITAGEGVENGSGNEPYGLCVYAQGKVNLSGNANIQEIYFENGSHTSAPTIGTWLTVQGAYTGETALDFKQTVALRDDVGNNAELDSVAPSMTYDIPLTGNDSMVAILEGSDVVIANKYTAEIHDAETREFISGHNNLADALEAYDGSNTDTYVVLGRNIYVDTAASEDVYLDLNTWNMVGNFQNDGYTLYCMDSATDDYTVADGWYGKITGAVDSLAAVPEGCEVSAPEGKYHAGYLQIDEDGAQSFHRLNLNIAYLYLDPSDASMNYEGTFAGDEKIAERVNCYGVTMSIVGEPTVTETDGVYAFCKHSAPTTSAYYGYTAGEPAEAVGTKLVNIISEGNSATKNKRNAQKPVYARAYVRLDSDTGEIILGQSREYTLRDGIEALDKDATAATDATVLAFAESYRNVISNWEIPNILATLPQKDVVAPGGSEGGVGGSEVAPEETDPEEA